MLRPAPRASPRMDARDEVGAARLQVSEPVAEDEERVARREIEQPRKIRKVAAPVHPPREESRGVPEGAPHPDVEAALVGEARREMQHAPREGQEHRERAQQPQGERARPRDRCERHPLEVRARGHEEQHDVAQPHRRREGGCFRCRFGASGSGFQGASGGRGVLLAPKEALLEHVQGQVLVDELPVGVVSAAEIAEVAEAVVPGGELGRGPSCASSPSADAARSDRGPPRPRAWPRPRPRRCPSR